jgi:hypothetical protein
MTIVMTVRIDAIRSFATWLLKLLAFHLTLMAGLTTSVADAAENIVVVVLDDSGSMNDRMRSGREPRMLVAKKALRKLVAQLPENTRLGVLLMNGSPQTNGWLIPLEELNRQKAISQIESVQADGGTPLGGSMKTAMEALLEYRRNQPIGDYRLLVVTDGEATDEEVLQQYLPGIVSRGIFIDVIGVDMQSDHSLALRSHSYRRADDAASLQRALTEVFAESSYSDDFDGAQADFDLIAAIPDDLAQQALATLTDLQSQPIVADSALTSGYADGQMPQGTPTGSRPGNNSWICTFFFVVLLLVSVRILVSVLGKITKK